MATSGTVTGSVTNKSNIFSFYFVWSAEQSISENASYITVTTYWSTNNRAYAFDTVASRPASIIIDGTTSSISKVFNCNPWPSNGIYAIQTVSRQKVEHNSDGTKTITISASANGYANSYGPSSSLSAPCTASTTIILDTIPRQATIISAPNFNDEQTPAIAYYNPAGNNVTSLQACISLTGSIADVPYRDIPKTTSDYIFNLTEAERNTLRNATTGSNSRSVLFIVRTIIGGNTFYSTLTRTLSIENATPIFTSSNLSYQDTNSSVVAITQNNQRIVQNKSSLRVTYTSATALKGASITGYTFILNGVTRTSSSAGGTVDFGAVNSANNLTLIAIATDSRGNSTSTTENIAMLEYSIPNAIVTLNRLNNYEDTSYLTVDGSVASVNNKNTMAIKYRYKLSGGSYNSFTNISDNVRQTLTLDKNNEYIFNVVVTDAFNETYNKEFVLGKGVFPLFIDTEKNSVGINGFPTHNRTFEVTGDIYQNGAKIIETGSNSNGNWIKFADGTMICTLNIIVTDQAINTAYGSLYQGYRVWNYPQTFIERPTVNCSQFFWGTSASWGSVSGVYGSQCTLRGHDVQSRAAGTSCQICATAIGKWK